jgi:3'-phosphoadenosine 5'-phosphosulfate (PAPS) 3'-phosphatase
LDKSPVNAASAASAGRPEQVLDPTTVADILSQRMILAGLRSAFPMVAVKGEEEEDANAMHIEFESSMRAQFPLLFADIGSSVAPPTWLQVWPEAAHADATLRVPVGDIVCWVDPLDGTKEFTVRLAPMLPCVFVCLSAIAYVVFVGVRVGECVSV